MAITIRRCTTQDAAAMAAIMGDPEIYPNLMQMPYTTEALWAAQLAGNDTPGRADLPLVAELDGKLAGSAGLHPASIAQRRRHAMMLGMSVAPWAQRQGVGSALLAALCDYADRWAGVLRLELTVYTDNVAAIALYRKFGFVIEGTHRGYAMRDGAYVDAHAMARLHPHPPRVEPRADAGQG